MWSQPIRSRAPSVSGYADSLPPHDWELLVRLPGRVVAAALASRGEPPGAEERLAAVAAIAAGGTSRSALQRDVVSAIYAHDDAHCGTDDQPDHVLTDCAAAGRVLAQRVPAEEAARYRRWVLTVGAVACGGGHLFRDDPIGAVQLRLLEEYERALAG